VRVRNHRTWIAACLAAAALLGSCGGGDDDGGAGAETAPPAAKPEDFPKPGGKTIEQLSRQYGSGGPVLAPSVSQLTPGSNRFGFGLFDRARNQVTDVPVALYVAPVRGGPAQGPFLARYESLKVDPRFHSRTVASDPDAARSVYVADIRFDKPGDYQILGLARFDDRLVVAAPAEPVVRVARKGAVPAVGDRAPSIHTETKEDAGGDIKKIDTREPPSSMHEVDFADVLGKKPVVLLFATPLLCQSRVCGPVVDIAEQVKAKRGDEAEFIVQEIFTDNEVDKGYRPQVLRYHLPTEPWLFTIDRKGVVRSRIEGAFSVEELNKAIDAAVKQ
jgi:hypothetical protein